MPYIAQNTIDKVRDLNILTVLQKYVTDLKQKGKNWQACSPFTSEKTASFTVSPDKNMFKCFSSGHGGDAIAFVMQKFGLDFNEAIEKIAQDNSIDIEYNESVEMALQRKEKYLKAEQKRTALSYSADWFAQNELPKTDKTKYWSKEDREQWQIGFAPEGWQNLLDWADKTSLSKESLIEACLAVKKADTGRCYDYFRNRITFPYHDHKGSIVGFVARAVADEQPKYLYSSDRVMSKELHLYGLNHAKDHIRKQGYALVVEGPTDVIALHKKGIKYSVGIGGSSIGQNQAELLKKYTDTVVLFPDNDCEKETNAGIIALKRNAEFLISKGFFVKVLIPFNKKNRDKSTDPEDFCKQFNDGDNAEFQAFFEMPLDYLTDFFLRIQQDYAKKGIKEKKQALSVMANIIGTIPDQETRNLTNEEIEKLWSDYKKHKGDKERKEKDKAETIKMVIHNSDDGYLLTIPEGLEWDTVASHYEAYDYFEFANQIWTAKTEGRNRRFHSQSNFTFEVLFHLYDDDFPKRLIKIINNRGKEMVVAVKTDDIAKPSTFKVWAERCGNYIWTGGASIERVKRFQFENEKSGMLKETLGHDNNGFFAMSNGVYHYETKQWINSDYTGVVEVLNKSYYIPSANNIFSDNESKFQSEKQFKYRPNKNVNFKSWSESYKDAFPDYGEIGLLFIIGSMFSDIIFSVADCYPILFVYGKGGTGKGSLIKRLLALFGDQRKPLKLSSGANTDKGMVRSLAQYCNASLLLDEYVQDKKVNEFCKTIWDRDGYQKANNTSRYGTDSTPINTTAMIASNHEPNDEPLFTRILYFIINAQSFSETQIQAFNKLKDYEVDGLGDVLLEILDLRHTIEKEYRAKFRDCQSEINKLLPNIEVSRLKLNASVLLAVYDCVHQQIQFPFDRLEIIKCLSNVLIQQQKAMNAFSEVALFFSTLQYLAQKGEISDKCHYKVSNGELIINMAIVYPIFEKEYINRERKRPKSKQALSEELKTHESYINYKNVRINKIPYYCFVFDQAKTGFEFNGYDNSQDNYTDLAPQDDDLPF